MGPGRTVSLIITLAVLWLLLSGHFEPLLLFFGLVSVLLVTWLAARMALADYEGHPVHLFWRAAVYWVWLLKEIVVANIDVVRCVLSPRLPISPTVFDVRSTQKTDLGRVMFANSITLTPGTVTLE
ncbi:MAG: Na+/H+ antiporter subunit E, partial [Ectothiorhodospiraceae bacterium]